MNTLCPNPKCAFPDFVIKDGHFRRKEDAKFIQRFRCKSCDLRFSNATFSDSYRQKKRRINFRLMEYLSSGMSLSRSARLLRVNPKTVERKLPLLAEKCRRMNGVILKRVKGRVHNIQIDDLITKENSKLKPLSVSLAVDENRRMILACEVSRIPAFGHLSKIALKKYGYRKDEHHEGLKRLFEQITPLVNPEVLVRSDEHSRYPAFVCAYLPRGKHETHKSERAHVAGQGELKKVSFDPLFAINHTCAMLRANINRLIRKTWCTTKDPKRLKDHLDIFIYYYNKTLLGPPLTPI